MVSGSQAFEYGFKLGEIFTLLSQFFHTSLETIMINEVKEEHPP